MAAEGINGTMRNGYMKLGFELGPHHIHWRHPGLPRYAGTNFDLFKEQALLAEQAKADLVFVADVLQGNINSNSNTLNRFESVSIMAALAAVTTRIGIVGTLSATFTEPFNLARQILSVDHISNGRAGWNLVTSDPKGTVANYGREEVPHQERYQIADEYLDVVEGLWDSFEDDALVQDKEQNVFVAPGKLHTLDHQGRYYAVKGPINMHRSVQGWPIIFTATSSADGKAFAGRRADAVFTFGVGIPECQGVCHEIKAAAMACGRDPSDVVVMPNASPIVGRTQGEAEAMFAEQAEEQGVVTALKKLGRFFVGYDVSRLAFDDPFPAEPLEANLNGFQGEVSRMLEYVRNNRPTVRQFAIHFGFNYGFHHFVGTPEHVADVMQEWFVQRACDGFVVAESIPGQFRMFTELVVPILRKRGLLRSEYTGTTLREHLGLPKPQNRFLQTQQVTST